MKTTEVKEGDKLQCIKSASPGYTEGKVYTVRKNAKGVLILDANDGYEDQLTNLVSEFKKHKGLKVV